MIWFDVVLDEPVDRERLRRGIAEMLEISIDEVDVVEAIDQIADASVTSVVEPASSTESYSQLITLYLAGPMPQPNMLQSATRLARTINRAMLIPDDHTANPYSFILISRSGQRSIVLVDADQLDEHDRYVIRHS